MGTSQKPILQIAKTILILLFAVNLTFASDNGAEKGNEKQLPKSFFDQVTLSGGTAAKVFGTAIGVNSINYEDPYDGSRNQHWAGAFRGEIDGIDAKFYCIDLKHPIAYYSNNNPHKYTNQEIAPEEITYILNNYYPHKPAKAGYSDEEEAASVQFALWHFADGVDPSTISNKSKVKTRALEIIADANTNASNFVLAKTLSITPTSQNLPGGTVAQFIVKATDQEGNPVNGMNVSLSASAGQLDNANVTTDANGEAIVNLTPNGAVNAVITASADAVLAPGTRYFHMNQPNKYQKLALAVPAKCPQTVEGSVSWYPVDDCDDDGNEDEAEFGFYKFVFNGITDNGNGTYTWSYTVTGKGAPKDLSHWALGLCADIKQSDIVSATPNNWAVQVDPRTQVYGIKWDQAVGKNGGTKTFTFTLSKNYLPGLMDVAFKAGTDNFFCTITAPTCEIVNCENKIGNYIWHDSNVNGIQDNDEDGIEGVEVLLYDAVGVRSVITDVNGYYLFDKLPNGTYSVKLAPANFEEGGVLYSTRKTKWHYTKLNQGSDESKDSDANKQNPSVTVTVECNDNLDVDFGFYKTCVTLIKEADKTTAKVGDVISYKFTVTNCGDVKLGGGVDVFDDMLKPGNKKLFYVALEPGQTKVITEYQGFEFKYTVKEEECGTQLVNHAHAEGHPVDGSGYVYDEAEFTVTIEDCEEKASLGDKVWYDDNKNGIQDNGENGVKGVYVTLYDCNFTNIFGVTQTDDNGNYLFTNLTPGDYAVEFAKPTGYTFSAQNQGNDPAKDSDADVVTGRTVCINLESGENDLTWDAGIFQEKAALGDYVWYDEDKDGIQDIGESGVEGITVTLYDCAKTVIHAVTQTDETGFYLFDNLNPGEYLIEFAKPQGFEFSPQNAGGDDEKDSDADVNTGETVCITLEPGDYDMSWDAGIYQPDPPQAEIKLVKSVSNENPQDGDVITYTIKVTNNGPADAEDVEVTDLLPNGVVYQSHNASLGSYDELTGLWLVGTLANAAEATLTITVQVDVEDVFTTSWDLGPAIGYNLFVLYDIDQPSSDTEGKAAIGRNASFANYSVGDKLANSNGTEDVLIVGNKLTYVSGAVYNGNIVYGKKTNLPQSVVSITGGTLRKDTPIDFVAARSYLTNLSTQLNSLDVNGEVKFEWGGFTLTGTDPFINIFEIDGADLSTANNVAVNVPNGAVVLVNIKGKNISWSGGLSLNGTNETNVLYNFPNTTKLKIQNIDVRGSVLAPRAKLNFVSGVVNGQVVAKYVEGMGQFNNRLFKGHIPDNKCVINIAEITKSSLPDPNSTPNNGVEGENDYDFAMFCVEADGNNGGGNNGGNNGNDWQHTGGFGNGEIIWSFCYDAQGNIYAGTYGGKIYISIDQGQNWTLINDGMNVAVIWTLVAEQGFVFAGTEQGIFRYDGSSWTLVGLQNKDVRTIVVDGEGTLYAGTWGFGIYKSTDLGLTWTECNSGLGYNLVISSITVTIQNEIIISTIGGGIHVSIDGGLSWETSSTSFDFAWTLDVTSEGVIYAGTYGSGVHVSVDGGYTWELSSVGLEAEFIYSVEVDVEDNVYISSLNSGVYVTYDGGYNWDNLGLSGLGISSIIVNTYSNGGNSEINNQTFVLAGSRDGQLYTKSMDALTSAEEVEELPTEFALNQNYPNPFNPTTQIEFSVPQAGNYSLRVYNAIGQQVAVLSSGAMNAGNYQITFDASQLASGLYIYQLAGNNVKMTKKMILMK